MEIVAREYPFKKEGNIQKRELYVITDECTITCIEKHDDDNSTDILYTKIGIEAIKEKKIYYANEYIPMLVLKQGAKDVDATIVEMSPLDKIIKYMAIDLKRNLITNSPVQDEDKNLNKTFSTISHLIKQWEHAQIYSSLFQDIYHEYELSFSPVVITRNYSKEDLSSLIESAKESISENKSTGIIKLKKDRSNLANKAKVKILYDFYNDIIILNGKKYSFQVLKFEKESENVYSYELKI